MLILGLIIKTHHYASESQPEKLQQKQSKQKMAASHSILSAWH